MTYVSHSKAFAAQADFPIEAKIKVGNNIWTPGTHGSRLYAEVLSKAPGTVGKVIDLAGKLDQPFTPKATMGHLRWLYTDGQLEVDGTSYVVQAKPKAEKVAKVEVAKPEAKVEAEPKAEEVMSFPPKAEKPEQKFKAKVKSKVAASRKPSLVRTKKVA